MNSRLVLKAADLERALTENDQRGIAGMNECRSEASASFKVISACESHSSPAENETDRVIRLYKTMEKLMREITDEEPRLHLYGFETPRERHGEVSRLIAELRHARAPGTTSSFTPLEYDTAGGRLREHRGFVVPFSGADEVERTVLGR